MRGVAVVVNDADAAVAVLMSLGMPAAPSVAARLASGTGVGAVLAGSDFLAVVSHERADVASTHYVYLAGTADTPPATAGGVAFRYWPYAVTASPPAKSSSIDGIDHIVALVDSIERAAFELRDLSITQSGESWDFPAIGARARLFQLEDSWLELNEPLEPGRLTLWGSSNGIIAVVLRTRDIERLCALNPGLPFSRVFPVRAHPSGSDQLVTLGLVTQLRHKAFGSLAVYAYQPFERGGGPDPKQITD